MISEITVAMQAGMSLGSLASVIHPYPTQVRQPLLAISRQEALSACSHSGHLLLHWQCLV